MPEPSPSGDPMVGNRQPRRSHPVTKSNEQAATDTEAVEPSIDTNESIDLRPPQVLRRIRIGKRTAAMAAAGVSTALSLWLTFEGDEQRIPAESPPQPVAACLQHTPDMSTEPGEVVTLDASVHLGDCKTTATAVEEQRLNLEYDALRTAFPQAMDQNDAAEAERIG